MAVILWFCVKDHFYRINDARFEPFLVFPKDKYSEWFIRSCSKHILQKELIEHMTAMSWKVQTNACAKCVREL